MFNNNIVSAIDDENQEVIIAGRGIGFGSHPDDEIDESKIEKIFRLDNNAVQARFKTLIDEIPLDILELTDDIILLAKEKLEKPLSEVIYVSLSDHINFARKRLENGITVTNPLSWEVRRFYVDEYEVAKEARNLIEQKLSIDLPEEEISNIALHFINAELNDSIDNVYQITQLMKEVSKIIQYHFRVSFQEEDVNYFRFMTHLKFFAQRVVSGTILDDADNELFSIIKKKFPKSFESVELVDRFIQQDFHYKMSDSEKLFLTMHVERLIKRKE